MKKVSRIIALSLAIMLVSGVAVFASGTITSVTPATQSVVADGDITITAAAPTTVDQITVVVYKGATADESSIAYIDQQPNTTGTVVFTFKMRDGFTAGAYTVKVGGTDVATADSSAVVNYGTSVKFTINGIVTPFGSVGDPTEDAKIAVTATLKNTNGDTVATKTADTATGAYSFTDVDAGVYTIVLTRPAALTKLPVDVDTANAVDGVVTVDTKQLYHYDVNPDDYIDFNDFFAVIPYFDTYPGDGGAYDPKYDITMDGYVDFNDLFAILPYFDYYGGQD